MSVDYRSIFTLDSGKRGGKPCYGVYELLSWLADVLSESEILEDYPELNATDIRSCLAFAADRQHSLSAII